MKEKVLWVDDMRDPMCSVVCYFDEDCYDVIWVKTYTDFCKYIDTNGLPDRIYFDHDLGFDKVACAEKSGMDCAKYLVNYCQKHNCDAPLVASQSANPVGRENILDLINSWHDFYLENQGKI